MASAGSRFRFFWLFLVIQWVITPLAVLYALVANRASPYALTYWMCKLTGVRFFWSRGSAGTISKDRVMFLCNHRGWGDFVIDSVLTSGGSYMSRLMVIVAVPWSALYGVLTGNMIFFHRKKGVDRDALATYVGAQWDRRPRAGLIVYPEGTRNQGAASKPLKHGCLDCALKLDRAVQCVVCTDKEHVANEKKLRARGGVRCVVSCSRVIHPRDPLINRDRKKFIAAVHAAWDAAWADAHAATPDDGGKSTVELFLQRDDASLVPGALAPVSAPPSFWRAWLARGACVALCAWAGGAPWAVPCAGLMALHLLLPETPQEFVDAARAARNADEAKAEADADADPSHPGRAAGEDFEVIEPKQRRM